MCWMLRLNVDDRLIAAGLADATPVAVLKKQALWVCSILKMKDN